MEDNTKVAFQCADSKLQKLYDTAEEKMKCNIKDFAGTSVLIEGGGYEKIWLETQPMGGEMYAKRNVTIGLNNQLMFMKYQREDGRIPGSIALIDGKVTPQFNKFQGFCFPAPALNLYYLNGKDKGYLDFLYDVLEKFDTYLWKNRDSDSDGCLESWCKYDTGEDHCTRYGDAPDAWEFEVPPKDREIVPMASIDFMSYSYSAREVLMEISKIKKDDKSFQYWMKSAVEVKCRIKNYLWNEEKGACFDRDKNHNELPTLIHNSLRAMYWNSLFQPMAEKFVATHLLNPNEFWTPMPLPSIAINDPLFRNVTTNNWSGQAQALTYQRAIRALENYKYDKLIPMLGNKLFEAIGEACIFVQQYDPFTMKPSKVSLEGAQDAYGPAMLSVLEYISRMYGIHKERDEIYWGCYSGLEYEYQQCYQEHEYKIKSNGSEFWLYVDNQEVYTDLCGKKVVTDDFGKIHEIINW